MLSRLKQFYSVSEEEVTGDFRKPLVSLYRLSYAPRSLRLKLKELFHNGAFIFHSNSKLPDLKCCHVDDNKSF